MAAGIFAILLRLTVPVVQWLVTVASVLSLTVVLWLTWAQLGVRRPAARLAATLALAAVTLWIKPVQQTLAFGQVNLVLMLVIVADLCLPDRRWWKGAGVGLAAGFKLTPLIFVPYLLLTRRFRAGTRGRGGHLGLTIGGSFALLPKAARQFWLGGLFLDSSRVGNISCVGDESLYRAATRLLRDTAAAHPYWLVNVAVVGRRRDWAWRRCSRAGARNGGHPDLRSRRSPGLACLVVPSLGVGGPDAGRGDRVRGCGWRPGTRAGGGGRQAGRPPA